MNGINEERLVAQLSEIVACACGFSPDAARRLRTATALHDIGKIKISGSIRNKPGKLDSREFEVMKTHTKKGAEILSGIQGELGVMARTVCLYHHEWHDGGGYWGRFAYELPCYVPVVSISDVFVALVSERTYKPAWPQGEALAYIEKQAGTQFSPALVEVFLSLMWNGGRLPALFMNDNL